MQICFRCDTMISIWKIFVFRMENSHMGKGEGQMKKKYLSFLCAVVMGMSLVACDMPVSKVPEEKTEVKTTESENKAPTEQQATSEDVTEEQKETVSADTPFIKIHQTTYDAGENSDYFYGYYETAEITGEVYPELKESVDSWFADFKTYYEEEASISIQNAKVDAESFGEDFTPHSDESSISIMRADNRVVSLSKGEYTFTGGVHGGFVVTGLNFDTKTGHELAFEDLGDIKDDVRKFTDAEVEKKRSNGASLEFYEDNIDSILESPLWYLDGTGLVIIFNAYDIASYAEGRTFVTIPYEEMKNFNPDYLPESDAGFVCLGEEVTEIDIDKDGTPEQLSTPMEFVEDYNTKYSLKLNDEVYEFEWAITLHSAYFVRMADGKSYVIVSYGSDNDYCITTLFDVTDKTLKQVDELSGGRLTSMSNYAIGASVKVDMLGSYMGYRTYRFENGKFEPVEGRFDFGKERNHFGYPTTKAAVKVMLTEDGKLVEKELPAGTTIYPVNSDGESVVGFELEDGTYGEITIEMKDGMKYIDGVEENEVFDSLPYAG